jgi:hypothetical protein
MMEFVFAIQVSRQMLSTEVLIPYDSLPTGKFCYGKHRRLAQKLSDYVCLQSSKRSTNRIQTLTHVATIVALTHFTT